MVEQKLTKGTKANESRDVVRAFVPSVSFVQKSEWLEVFPISVHPRNQRSN
jgi:hypothetical protein